MEPLYVAKKLKICSFTPLRILFFWLIIPIIFIVVDILKTNVEKVEFLDKKIKERKGLISKNEKDITFKGVVSVNVEQSFFGRLFNYGKVYIDLVGKDNVILENIAKPYELKKFLETKLVDLDNSQTTMIA